MRACNFEAQVHAQKTFVLACGARSGKDRVSVRLAFVIAVILALVRARNGCTLIPRVNVWVVAPRYSLLRQWWEELLEVVPQEMITGRQKLRSLSLVGGIVISLKSADRPEMLVSEGVDILVVTEAARVGSNSVWYESLLPRLASPGRFALALVNSTPACGPDHFFRQIWDSILQDSEQRDQEDPKIIRTADGLRAGWNLPSTCNPEMAVKLADLARDMRPRHYASEILAQWIEDGDSVFLSEHVNALFAVSEATDSNVPAPLAMATVVGCDPARLKDRTVIMAMEVGASNIVARCCTMQGVELHSQINQLKAFLETCNGPELVVDATGFGGEVFLDEVKRLIPNVRLTALTFQGGLKEQLVFALAHGIETGAIKVSSELGEEHASQLRKELLAYKATVLDSGKVTYSGRRDDYVIALALCWWRARSYARGVDNFSLETFWRNFF
jgi:hypothetical protein